MSRSLKPWAALAGALLLAAACSGGGSGGVSVTLDEYSVRAEPGTVPAGQTAFEIRNTGSIEHDFIVLETELEFDELPLEEGQVDLESSEIDELEHIHAIDPGERASGEVALASGTYLLICNVPGHYQTGMRTPFEVE